MHSELLHEEEVHDNVEGHQVVESASEYRGPSHAIASSSAVP